MISLMLSIISGAENCKRFNLICFLDCRAVHTEVYKQAILNERPVYVILGSQLAPD